MEVESIPQAIIGTIFMAGGSYVYANVAQVSSLHTGLIVVIADLVDTIFYLIAQQNRRESDKLAAYIFTNQIMSGIAIITLYYFEIIAELGACLLVGASLYNYYGKVCALQEIREAEQKAH